MSNHHKLMKMSISISSLFSFESVRCEKEWKSIFCSVILLHWLLIYERQLKVKPYTITNNNNSNNNFNITIGINNLHRDEVIKNIGMRLCNSIDRTFLDSDRLLLFTLLTQQFSFHLADRFINLSKNHPIHQIEFPCPRV